MLKFAYKEIDITPKVNIEMIGFGREIEKSQGVLDKLLSQISIWEFNLFKCVLITVDHIGFSLEHCDILRDSISDCLEIKKENIMLCFSHTHSSFNDTFEENYFNIVLDKILEAIIKINTNLKPVKIGYDCVNVEIGVNRREGNNTLDKRLLVIKLVNDYNEIELILLRLSSHANVLKADNYLLSSDFFHKVRELVNKEYNCPVMITQGSSGNVAPKYYNSKLTPYDAIGPNFIKSDDALFFMANTVLKGIKKIIHKIELQDIKYLSMYSRFVDFESQVPNMKRAIEIAEEARVNCFIDGTDWLNEISRLNKEKIVKQNNLTEVQYFIINEMCLCGVPNEVMCEFAISISKNLKNPYFYFGGYTNGCTGYFPTEEEFDLGGYEIYWSLLIYYKYFKRVFPFNRDSASKLITFVLNNFKKN